MKISNNDFIDFIINEPYNYKNLKQISGLGNKQLFYKLLNILRLQSKNNIQPKELFLICLYLENASSEINFSNEEKVKTNTKIDTFINSIDTKNYLNKLTILFINNANICENKKTSYKISLLIDLIVQRENIAAIEEFSKEIIDFKKNEQFKSFYNSLLLKTLYFVCTKTNNDEILYNLFILKLFGFHINNEIKLNEFVESMRKQEHGKSKIYLEEVEDIIRKKKELNKTRAIKKYDLKEGYFETPKFDIIINNSMPQRTAITIDNAEGQPFKDDAISLKKEKNEFILGIHISDVGFITYDDGVLNSILFERFKSIYYPGKKMYLFPKLSDISTICSLNAGGNKNVISLYIIIKNGLINDYYLKKDEIKIIKNLSYRDSEDILSNKNRSELKKLLFELKDLTHELKSNYPENQNYRNQKNSFTNTDNNQYNTESHSIIEECMILYNYLVSKEMNLKGYDYIYRNLLPSSKELEIGNLTLTKKEKEIIRKYYMNPYYSLINEGHVGIGKDTYSHSSSPLRRFVDLFNQYLVHFYYFNDIDFVPCDDLEYIVNGSNKREKELALCKYEFTRFYKNGK